jgi:hypothetical protein
MVGYLCQDTGESLANIAKKGHGDLFRMSFGERDHRTSTQTRNSAGKPHPAARCHHVIFQLKKRHEMSALATSIGWHLMLLLAGEEVVSPEQIQFVAARTKTAVVIDLKKFEMVETFTTA